MTEFREVLVLGVGRSGSNLLCSILRGIDGNAGFFEIFSASSSEGVQAYPGIAARIFARFAPGTENVTNADFLAARDADPVAYFDALSAAARAEGHASMTCKIFGRQISIPHLTEILARPNLSVIFLTRRRIDRHISGVKGHISGAYVKADYTDLRPPLDLTAFLEKVFLIDQQYDAMQDCVRASGVPHSLLNYDRDLDIAADLRGERITAALRQVGFPGTFATAEAESWLKKQDQTPDWRDKVANGFEAAAALAGLGLLDYAESAPLTDVMTSPRTSAAAAASPRDHALLDEGGYNLAVSADPVITLTAIQYGRSFMAEWMAGPEPAFGTRRGVHFLKPTWTMETTDLRPLAETLRRAEACNPGHSFVAQHVSDREAQKYREVGIRSIPGNPNIFTNEAHFVGEAVPHPDLPDSDAIYVARLAPWKQHELAAQLQNPLFVYGEPVDPSESAQFDKLRDLFPLGGFINHRLGQGKFHYLGRQELASVMARTRVALALSSEEGCMRASVECLLAGLPIVSVPSIGGRELLFTPDTALIVEPTPEAVRAGVDAMLARGLGRDEVRRATLDRVREERQRFLDAANRHIANALGPIAPRLTMEPLLDYTIRYVPLRKMIEALG
jgi:glycosyltransferase involved in cell wall biosynthesis